MTTPRPSRPSITCPRCTRTSHHPDDITNGYCGACCGFTSAPAAAAASARIGLAAIVAGFYYGLLRELAEQAPNARLAAVLQAGADDLAALAPVMVSATEAADTGPVLDELNHRLRQLLATHKENDRDGWMTTGLSWVHYALLRVERALNGAASLEELGLLSAPGQPGPVASLTSARDAPATPTEREG